ncbi:MAG TPA: tetratricopeptide repeat protein [Pirellulales bacterium]|jgi:tetratricopeptide (TPR) repeat protein|nr:tetratricopeptide repeat protein [Pirellulales bacterium]
MAIVRLPWLVLWHHLSLVDDAIDVVHHRRQRWWQRWLSAAAATARRGWHLALVPWSITTRLLWELLDATGVVRDDLSAARARSRGLLKHGVPILIAALGLCAVCVFVLHRDSQQVAQAYTKSAEAAWQQHDFATAARLYSRLAELRPETVEHRYRRALAEYEAGNVAVGEALMAAIAPQRATGYLPGHLWAARQLLAEPQTSPEQTELARRHLQRVLLGDPTNGEANLLMAKMLLASGQQAEAEPYLQRSVGIAPAWHLLLAEIGLMKNNPQAAREQAGRARDYFARQLDAAPRDITARESLAKAYVLLGGNEAAIDVLRQGIAQHSSAELRGTLSQALVARAIELKAHDDTAEQRFELLREALELDPSSTAATIELVAVRKASAAVRERANELLSRITPESAGGATALAYLALGNAAWKERDYERARQSFEEAHRRAPDDVAITNNLAWSLSQAEPRDLPRARQLCDDALARTPGHASLLDTRARVSMQLGQWREASIDWEVLSFLRPDDAELRRQLRECRQRMAQLSAVELLDD